MNVSRGHKIASHDYIALAWSGKISAGALMESDDIAADTIYFNFINIYSNGPDI